VAVRVLTTIGPLRYAMWRYGYEPWAITPGEPIPDWLLPLRERAATLKQDKAEAIREILLSQYPPGAGIGWHRDAPMFGSKVGGLSLLGPCRLRFQRQRQAARDVSECQLEPRSAYLLSGEARLMWQHAIPHTKVLRYSISFRSLKTLR
jgi:alkylated DNA repair protein (DNA oxidative demethylase)